MATGVRVGSRPHRAPSDSAIAFGVVLAALGVALFTSVKAPELVGQNALVLAPFVAIPVWLMVTDKPQLALAVLLVYLGLVDGFVKLKVGTELPTLGRDLLLYALAIGMLLRAKATGQRMELPPLSGWVLAFVAVVLVQLLNPANQSTLHSVAALRQHIEFVPLFFIGYAVMRNKQRLRIFFLLLLVVANVNGAVSFIQFNMSPDQLAGWGPGYSDLINGVGGVAPRTSEGADGEKRVRPPGLGSDMGFAGNLGAVALPGALALLALGRFNRRQAIFAAALTPGAVVAIITSQSRSVVVVGVVAVVVFAALALLAGAALRIALAGIVTVILGMTAISFVGNSDDGAFYRYSSVRPGELVGTTVESRSRTFAQIPVYAQEFPLGAGIGSVGPAASFSGTPRGLNAESQFTFMIVELGLLGLIIFICFQARLLGIVMSRMRRLKDRETRLLMAALVTPLVEFIAMWVIGVTTTSSPNAPYIWFAAGTAAWWMYRSELAPQPLPATAHVPAPAPVRTPSLV